MSGKGVIIGFFCILIFFSIYLMGLMKLIPIYFAAPPLFISIFFTIWKINHRKKFKGFYY